jgi:polyisoprenyl-phosphate glycosyltransferase
MDKASTVLPEPSGALLKDSPPVSPAPPLISVVSPVYRAEACLDELCRRLVDALASLPGGFEIVLVDDGSPDGSWPVVEQLAAKDARIVGVQLARNFGQHHAISAGLSEARGRWVVVMDCDLQDRPEEIPRLYAKAQDGFDCVLARRAERRDDWTKRLSSWAFYKIFNYLTDLNYDGTVANFSIVRRRVVDELLKLGEATRFYGGFLTILGFSRAYVDVQHDARFAGASSYTFLKLVRMASNVILAHSNKPLRLCVQAGMVLSGLSFVAAIGYLIYTLLYGTPVMGWPTLIISVYFSTGVIVFVLGVLGLYVDRIFAEVKRRPIYVVRKRTNEGDG